MASCADPAAGPVGAEREPRHCKPHTDSKGNRMTRKDLTANPRSGSRETSPVALLQYDCGMFAKRILTEGSALGD